MEAPSPDRRAAIRFIVCVGLVSLFADMTYEGAYSSIGSPLEGLGAGALAVGLISGGGEMVGASLRYFSGRFADRTHSYWTLVIVGYVLNLVAIPALISWSYYSKKVENLTVELESICDEFLRKHYQGKK